jgi:PAS domain S-box-containing protein
MVESAVQSHAEIVIDSTEKSKIRVLHVDDEPALLKVAKQCLEMQGPFQVDTANSVEEALSKLEKERYDAVISDYQMPGKDGLEFLKELRESGNKTPFIMFTGKGREEIAIRALNLGANQYLNKAGEPETVYMELAHAITESAKTKKAEELLRLSEEKYKGLFENAIDVIILFDLKGNVTSANKAAEEYGFNKSEMLGKSMLKFVSKRYWPKLLKDVAQIALGKTAEGRLEISTPKGDKIAEYRSSPILSRGKVVGIQTILEDATERKKAEEASRESEEKYRDLFENAMDAIVTLDLKGSITAVNNSVLRFGFKKEDMVGKNIFNFVSKDYWPAITKDFSKVTQGEPAKNEIELIVPTGKIIGEYSARAIVKENNLVGVQINIRDVTERRKVEQALKESEEKYRGLVELAPDGIVAVNVEGIVTSVNRSFLALVGYDSAEEIVGKAFTELMTIRKEDIPKFQGMFNSLMKGESPSPSEFFYVRRDGTSRWAEVHPGLLIKDGNPVGVQAIVRDVSERKNAEKLVQENHQKFEELFMRNPEATAYLNQDFRIQDINPRFEELFGYSLADVQGKHINDIVVPDERRKEGEALDKKAKKGYVYHNTVRRKKNRSLVQVSISAAPITVGDKVIGIVTMYHDISDLKNAEKRLDVMNEKLRVVGSLTRHDVRNKLAAIVGNAYLLKKRLTGDSNTAESLRSIEMAVRESEKIFDFAAAYENLGVEQLAYMDVQKTVEEAVGLFPDLKGVKIVNDCGGLMLLADSLLRQLFCNLIDDSLKYGEKLTQIRIRYEKSENQLKLVYEDDGVGISQDAKPKLFSEGYTTGKGSGYGLYLIRRMMEVYGWAIQETGNPGNGVCFTIVIPAKNQDGKENYQLY